MPGYPHKPETDAMPYDATKALEAIQARQKKLSANEPKTHDARRDELDGAIEEAKREIRYWERELRELERERFRLRSSDCASDDEHDAWALEMQALHDEERRHRLYLQRQASSD